MLRAVTILFGSILSAMLVVQLAAVAAAKVLATDTDSSLAIRPMSHGVVALGLMLTGTILVLRRPIISAAVFFIGMFVTISFQQDYDSVIETVGISDSNQLWMRGGMLVVALLAFASALTGEAERELQRA